jgi:GAF domain-containing protein
VASRQLHSTLDPAEVVKVILEIVINPFGAEIFALYLCDEPGERLVVVASEGDRETAFPTYRLGEGFVGRSVACAEIHDHDPARPHLGPSRGGEPLVSIPLHVGEVPVGAIVIYTLLQQKPDLSSLDHDLFGLLAIHAATAISASRLHAQSERKLSTIQGFIDLLTK